MKDSTYDPLRGFSLQGTASHVSLGWLMSPDEFARDCLTLKQRPMFDSWAVSTQMPDEIVRVMQSPLIPNAAGLSMMVSNEHIVYPVVTLQSAGLQVRIVLCLANPDTQNWLRAVTSAGAIKIALEIPEVDQVAVIGMPCEVRPDMNVDALIRTCATPDHQTYLRDARQLIRNLAELDGLPSLIPGFEPQHVRLVLVFETGPGQELRTPEAAARVLN